MRALDFLDLGLLLRKLLGRMSFGGAREPLFQSRCAGPGSPLPPRSGWRQKFSAH
jgi:hypothetical protein